jgi:hypothetical protein
MAMDRERGIDFLLARLALELSGGILANAANSRDLITAGIKNDLSGLEQVLRDAGRFDVARPPAFSVPGQPYPSRIDSAISEIKKVLAEKS